MCAVGIVNEFLSAFPFSDSTRKTYGYIAEDLVRLDVRNWSAADLVRYVERPEWGSSHRYVVLCAARKFIEWQFGAKHPALAARVRRLKGRRQRVLDADAALRLLASFDPSSIKGARDLALSAVALDTGLRVSELCRLRLADVDFTKRRLQVICKGGKWGEAMFSAATAAHVERWLAMRPGKAPTVFCSTRDPFAPLTVEGLQVIVRRWGEVLGVKLSPHDLRRTFATLAVMNGAPTRVVQVAGRWSDVAMVELYTRSLDGAAIEPYLPVSRLVTL